MISTIDTLPADRPPLLQVRVGRGWVALAVESLADLTKDSSEILARFEVFFPFEILSVSSIVAVKVFEVVGEFIWDQYDK